MNWTRSFSAGLQEMIGKRISHYRVLEKIGEGGMGEVYLAEDSHLDRRVALKFLPVLLDGDSMARQRFLREAKLSAALDHPYVCQIHEIGEHEGRFFIALEYVVGETLGHHIQARMGVETAVRLAKEMAEALARAHAQDIVHRDLKPSNVMVSSEGHPKLMDFGLAKRIVSSDGQTQEVTLTELTSEGSTVGTVAYMSPEQVRGEDLDVRTDVFSFGILFYEMLTGRHPFRQDRGMETMTAILRDDPIPLSHYGVPHAERLQPILNKTLSKDRNSRYPSGRELLEDLEQVTGQLAPRRPEMRSWSLGSYLFAAASVILVILAALWFLERQSNINWARREALPEIERMMDDEWRDYTEPYALAVAAEEYIPDDPRLVELMSKVSLHISIESDPPGAMVSFKPYKLPSSEWQPLGVTPLTDVRLPIGFFRWRFEKDGFETVQAAHATWDLRPVAGNFFVPNNLFRRLEPTGTKPAGMVLVQGGPTPAGPVPDFYIDEFEVTNRDYKRFVDAGGYTNPKYWEHDFVDGDSKLTFELAMDRFVDQTGQPGPASWYASRFPSDQADHPVTGVSWYEAAAYARFVGKRLPSSTHWGLARGDATSVIRYPQLGGYELFAPYSNFRGRATIPVGSLPGITPFGAYDMAGNAREWCQNPGPSAGSRVVRGGAWDSPTYLFNHVSQLSAMDRSVKNGFRCVLYPDPEALPEGLSDPPPLSFSWPDYSKIEPISDSEFQHLLRQFDYPAVELNARTEANREGDGWVYERVTFDTGYSDDRMLVNLFLPRNASPPYQVVVYFPGSAALFQGSSDHIDQYYEFTVFSEFIVTTGRALLFPAYTGTFERRTDISPTMHQGHDSSEYADWVVQVGKDFRRTLDFVESRPDLDKARIAYYGLSWGGLLAGLLPAIDDRVRTNIALAGGLFPILPPKEVNSVLYLPRITVPTLMLNGHFDTILPAEYSYRPMFELLGTPPENKRQILYNTDHIPPRREFIREIVAWLDKYLGPVQRKSDF